MYPRRRPESLYSPKEAAVMAFCGGLLVGMIVSFASCSPPEPGEPPHHITEVTQ